MADDPERIRRREFLVKEKDKLVIALQWLDSTAKSAGNSPEKDSESEREQKLILDTNEFGELVLY